MEVSEPWSQQAAWQALLALRPRLRRFASGLTGSLDEADDLVQAVYERAVGEREVEARLALADVRRLVAELPADQRAALMLVAVDGLTYADAADVLSVPPGTVASRVARARLALALAMEGKEVASPAPEPALARSGS